MPNNRIFYAAKQIALRNDASAYATQLPIRGCQSANVSTNFNLTQVFELGQAPLYANIEDIPDVQITINKVLDGNPPAYLLATKSATSPTLFGRASEKSIAVLSFYSDTATAANGTALSAVEMSGLFVGSVGYTFTVDDNGSEDLTLVGNDKVWKNDTKIVNSADSARAGTITATGFFGAGTDTPPGSGGVQRRQHINWTHVTGLAGDSNGMYADPDVTILPPEVGGISSSGLNLTTAGQLGAHVQRIGVSLDFGREPINELGRKSPYTRTPSPTIEVTTEIEAITTGGDFVSATENGILTTSTNACSDLGNLRNRTIRIATCDGTRIYLGLKNKLASVEMGGADAGGGNETVTYTFTTFNDFTVLHVSDPNPSGSAWWANRTNYLTN